MPAHFIALLLLLLSSCAIKVKVPTFDTHQTMLQKQIMGTYKSVDDRMVFIASLRQSDKNQEHGLSKVEKARLNQIFNQDDIDDYLNKGFVGETEKGLLMRVPSAISQVSQLEGKELEVMKYLLLEENHDREVIMLDILASQSKSTLKEVRQAFFKVQLKKLKINQWYMNESNQWQKKTDTGLIK